MMRVETCMRVCFSGDSVLGFELWFVSRWEQGLVPAGGVNLPTAFALWSEQLLAGRTSLRPDCICFPLAQQSTNARTLLFLPPIFSGDPRAHNAVEGQRGGVGSLVVHHLLIHAETSFRRWPLPHRPLGGDAGDRRRHRCPVGRLSPARLPPPWPPDPLQHETR